jgi:hypothetical protein
MLLKGAQGVCDIERKQVYTRLRTTKYSTEVTSWQIIYSTSMNPTYLRNAERTKQLVEDTCNLYKIVHMYNHANFQAGFATKIIHYMVGNKT